MNQFHFCMPQPPYQKRRCFSVSQKKQLCGLYIGSLRFALLLRECLLSSHIIKLFAVDMVCFRGKPHSFFFDFLSRFFWNFARQSSAPNKATLIRICSTSYKTSAFQWVCVRLALANSLKASRTFCCSSAGNFSKIWISTSAPTVVLRTINANSLIPVSIFSNVHSSNWAASPASEADDVEQLDHLNSDIILSIGI